MFYDLLFGVFSILIILDGFYVCVGNYSYFYGYGIDFIDFYFKFSDINVILGFNEWYLFIENFKYFIDFKFLMLAFVCDYICFFFFCEIGYVL